MTLPSPPAVGSGGFQGVLVPADVQQQIINTLIQEAAFASSITPLPTSSGSVAFPIAGPTGAAWIAELAKIPLMCLNDRAEVVAVAKLAGLLDVGNEMMSDASINLTAQFTVVLRDSLSSQLDDGLLNGGGPPEPQGVIAAAAEVTGADLLEAVLTARGAIADAGGTATTLAASGATLAAADGARDSTGALMFPGGFAAVTGLIPVTVPDLATPLVYDRIQALPRGPRRLLGGDEHRLPVRLRRDHLPRPGPDGVRLPRPGQDHPQAHGRGCRHQARAAAEPTGGGEGRVGRAAAGPWHGPATARGMLHSGSTPAGAGPRVHGHGQRGQRGTEPYSAEPGRETVRPVSPGHHRAAGSGGAGSPAVVTGCGRAAVTGRAGSPASRAAVTGCGRGRAGTGRAR